MHIKITGALRGKKITGKVDININQNCGYVFNRNKYRLQCYNMNENRIKCA